LLDAEFEQPDIYYMHDWHIYNDSFKQLNTTSDDNGPPCVVASVAQNQVILRPADCMAAYPMVCKAVKNMACNATSSSSQAPQSSNLLDYIFDPKLKTQSIINSQFMTKDIRNLFKRLNQTASYKSLFSMMWYSTLPCFDVQSVTSSVDGEKGMLRSCQWKGTTVPCSAIFTQARPKDLLSRLSYFLFRPRTRINDLTSLW